MASPHFLPQGCLPNVPQYRLVNKFHQSIQVRRLEGEADRVVINDLDAFHMVGSAVMVSVSAQQSGGKLIIALAKIGMAGGFIGERHILSSKASPSCHLMSFFRLKVYTVASSLIS